jgi:hypothetical protein
MNGIDAAGKQLFFIHSLDLPIFHHDPSIDNNSMNTAPREQIDRSAIPLAARELDMRAFFQALAWTALSLLRRPRIL